jgi:hypothetical protein
MEALLKAVGGGVGKHGQATRRTRRNKYAPKAPPTDPLDQAFATAKL